MVTFLDVTGLEHFTNIFVFVFVWIVIYATLLWTRLLGENKFVMALVGLLLGIFVLISPSAISVIANVAPFIAVLLVLTMLLNMTSRMLGSADVGAFPAIKVVLLVFIVLIIIVGSAMELRDDEEEPTDLAKSTNLIFNPKFLGVVLVFAIAVFTIALLASRTT